MLAPAATKGAWAKFRRFVRRVVVVSACALLALVVSLAAVLLYLQSAPGRRWLSARVSDLVSRELVADLRIERLDVISPRRVVVARATLSDGHGRALLAASGLEVRFELFGLLEHILFGPEVSVAIPEVTAERLEVGLYRDTHGDLVLEHAFDSATPSTSGAPSRPLRLRLPRIVVRSVSVRNNEPDLAQAEAELGDLGASLEVSHELFSLDLHSDRLRVAKVLPVELHAALRAQVRLPGTTDASLSGSLGTLPVKADFRAHGDELSLHASSPALAPDGVKRLLPAWPILVPLSAEVEFSGRPAALRVRAEASANASRVTASGSLALTPALATDLTLDARALDLRLLAADAPSTAFGLVGQLSFHQSPSARVELTARVLDGELAGQHLPETNVHAVYAKNELSGTAAVLDPKLPLDASFTLSPSGALDFHARAQALALRALAPYGVDAEGSANIEVSGALAHDELALRLDATLRDLGVAPVGIRSATLHGTLGGSTARAKELGVALDAKGTHFHLGRVDFPSFELKAEGSLGKQLVTARAGTAGKESLTASTTLAFGGGVTLTDTHAAADLDGVEARLELAEIRAAARSLDVRGLRFELGDGEIEGSALFADRQKRVELVVSDFNPSPLLPTLGLDAKSLAGRFDGRLSFEEDARHRAARLEAGLENGALGELSPLFGQVTATLDGSELKGRGTLTAASLGRGNVLARARLEQGPLTFATFAAALDELKVDFSDLDLAEVEHRFAPAAPDLAGHAQGSLWVARKDPKSPLEAGYELEVRELVPRAQGGKRAAPALKVDLASRGSVDASETHVELDVKDADGIWIRTRAALPRGISRALELMRTGRPDDLLDAPVRAELVALPRKLDHFGGAQRSLPRGDFSGALSVTGTVAHPRIEGSLNVSRLAVAGVDSQNELAALLGYSAEREEYSVSARATAKGVEKFELEGGGHCGWVDHGFGRDFSLESRAHAEHVALAPVGDVLGVKLAGELSGRASIAASTSSFEASGDFEVKGLALDRRALGNGSGSFGVHRGLAEARLAIADERAKLELSSELGLDWHGGAPRVDAQRGGNVQAEVRNYELAVLAPLLRAFVSEVRGPINGFASLEWGPEDAKGKRKTKLRANASVSGASFRLASGIGSIQNAEVRAIAENDDKLYVTFSGSASSKEPNVSAKAELAWDGLLPRRVEAEVRTTRLPVSYEGVLLGTATVDKKARPLRVVLDLGGAEQRAEVSVPALEFELPPKEDTRLIELSPDPVIRVTDAAAPPEVASVAGETSSLVLTVNLGAAVRIKQPDLLVPVTGKIARGGDGRLDGALVLPEGGTVSAFGQVFRLKQSSVRFSNQPVELGVLMIQASARTVEGIVVDLDVSGTVQKPVVRFRSDPPRSESEIVSLLLGIRPDDSNAVPGQQDVGGSAMALAMNQLLRNSPLAGFQFGETQSRTGDTISTVSFRASNKVWVEGWSTRQNQGTPYEATRSSGVVDWRFAPGFSLRTQLGYPSGLEMRWSHRY
jgi:hypothetical protein